MLFGEVLRIISALFGLLLSLCYFYQILYLWLPVFKKEKPAEANGLRRYAILIAARNEETVLPYLLQSIQLQDYPADYIKVFVVADNCTDRTAVVAEEGGAVVFRRSSETQVGKGYALHYLLERIDESENLDSFDAFLIFDADNLLKQDFIRQINRVASQGYDVFCGCRNSKNFGSNWVSSGHALWYLHESAHLNRSRMLLGLPCMVNGTGFGFTRALLRRMGGWNFFTLTEDVEFSNWCVTHNVRSGYCHEAVLYDEQPVRFSQSWRQRTRWVQGGIQVSIRYWRPLLLGMLQGGKRGYSCLEAATLSLWGYGMGLVCGFLGLLAALLCAGWIGLGNALLLTFLSSLGATFLIGIMTLLAQWRHIHATTGQKLLALLAFPLHVFSYLPIAVSALFRKFQWPPISHTAAVSVRDMQQ